MEERLGFHVMEALTHLLSSNSQNAAVFRESGGAKCAVALVPYLECRLQALGKCIVLLHNHITFQRILACCFEINNFQSLST